MTPEEIKAKYFQIADVWSTGNVAALDEVCAANLVFHLAPFPDMNLDGVKQFMGGFHMAFPDFHGTIDEDIVAGNTSVHRWIVSGTYTGQSPLLPVPPTGKLAKVPGCTVVHWEGGKAVEIWQYGDWLGWFQQLGIIPAFG